MLKRPIVSLFHFLNPKRRRYYWIPPNPEELNKLSLIKQKYDIPKDVLEHMEDQEQNIKQLTTELTNQKKVIEKIYSIVQHINNYNYDSRILHILTLFNTYLILISKH